MTALQIRLAEAAALVLGVALIVIGVGAWDWRAGVILAGAALVLAASDRPGRRP